MLRLSLTFSIEPHFRLHIGVRNPFVSGQNVVNTQQWSTQTLFFAKHKKVFGKKSFLLFNQCYNLPPYIFCATKLFPLKYTIANLKIASGEAFSCSLQRAKNENLPAVPIITGASGR